MEKRIQWMNRLEWWMMIFALVAAVGEVIISVIEKKGFIWPLIAIMWIMVAMRHKSEVESLKKSSNSKKDFYN